MPLSHYFIDVLVIIQEYLREERAHKHEIKKEVYIDRRFVVLFK